MTTTKRSGSLVIPRGTLPGPRFEHVSVTDEGDGVFTFYNKSIGKRVSVPDSLRGQIKWLSVDND